MVFSRTPEPGEVKTRLVPALGAEGAARLHERLTHRAVRKAVASGVGSVELWCTPTTVHPFFSELASAFPLRLRLQRGIDLGERMAAAFDDALSEASTALLIGSDSPDLGQEDLRAAMTALEGGCDVVLGPAADGGYLLIGLRCPVPELFRNMPWGTAEVLALTRERLGRSGRRWNELPVRHDLDRPEDLSRFPDLRNSVSESL